MLETWPAMLLVMLPNKILLQLFDWSTPECDEKQKLKSLLQRQIFMPKQLAQTRIDALLIILLLTISFCLYGEFWYGLPATLLGRGLFISFFANVTEKMPTAWNCLAA